MVSFPTPLLCSNSRTQSSTNCESIMSASYPNGPSRHICRIIVSMLINRQAIRGDPHILHTALQAWLNRLWVPSENPHNRSPTQTRKNRPCICLHPFSKISSHTNASLTSSLHTQLRQSKHDSCEDIYDDLLIYAALDAPTKDKVSPCKTSQESVERHLFTGEWAASKE